MKPYTLLLFFFPVLLLPAKSHKPLKKVYTDYYFHYVGPTGYEADPALWQFLGHDLGNCSCTYESEASCVIKVDPDVVLPKNPAGFEISSTLLYLKYSTFTLPMMAGRSPFLIPDRFAYLGLYMNVINTSVNIDAYRTSQAQ